MLRRLALRDFVIVDRLELEFEAGFGALTGETGAGKSILVDALVLMPSERCSIAMPDSPDLPAKWLRLSVSGSACAKRAEKPNTIAQQACVNAKCWSGR